MTGEALEAIRQSVAEGHYQYSLHALQRTTERHISRSEVEQAIAVAEIIESYPDDKYKPSYLLFGNTNDNRPLHIQVCLPPHVKIITVYEPDPNEWENYRVRKPHV